MQPWLVDRINALFDALLAIGVYLVVAQLPVPTSAKVAVLISLLAILYAVINVGAWLPRVGLSVVQLVRRTRLVVSLTALPYRSREDPAPPAVLTLPPAPPLPPGVTILPERLPSADPAALPSADPEYLKLAELLDMPPAPSASGSVFPIETVNLADPLRTPCFCDSGKRYIECHGKSLGEFSGSFVVT